VLISSREAAQILAASGLTRDRARRVLQFGFAGDALRTRGSLLYEDTRVRALLDWPDVDPGVLRETCTHGLFVARVRNVRPELAGDVAGDLAGDLAGELALREWQLSPWARLEMRRVVEAQGFLPLVATVCGFVASGANITAVWPGPSGTGRGSRLDLDEPGAWFEEFQSRKLVSGPGSAWLFWRPRPAAGKNSTLQQ